MRKLHVSAVVCSAFVLSGPSIACESEPRPVGGWPNPPITVAPDGSFRDGNYARTFHGKRYVSPTNGGPVRDIGGGRVGQKLWWSEACSGKERLLFVDCTTADAVIVDGRQTPKEGITLSDGRTMMCPVGASCVGINLIQKPLGPIGLTSTTTVSEVRAIAEANDLGIVENVAEERVGVRWNDRYDPFFGCKLFYPDSPGAQQ